MDTNICSALDRARTLFGDHVAMVDGPTRWTYRQLGAYVESFDAALDDAELKIGDVVGILAKNSRAHLIAWLGIPRSGRVLNELNTRLSPAELEFILDDSDCRVLIVDDDFLDVGRKLRDTCAALVRLIYAGTGQCPTDCDSFDEAIASGRCNTAPRVGGEATAGIFYTGGTTGRPKGVVLTHDNLVANAKHALIAFGYTDKDTYLHAGPMFHLADGASTVALTWVGGTHVIVPSFDPHSWLATVTEQRVTHAMLVPTMITMLVAQTIPDEFDLSSLRSILYGASPMPLAVLRTAADLLDCDWCQVYGMTEGAPIITFLTHEDHREGISRSNPDAETRLRSAGRPVVGVDVAVLNTDGQRAQTGAVGEIIASGPNIMKGYLNRPEETAQVLIDGWYHTGDMGYLDDAGYLYVVDRLKDMIISGGENVYSTEVENAIYRHADVLEVAVFGIPDDQWGEAVHASVVLRPSASTTADELREHTRTLLAGFKVPRVVHIINELPKSGAGKILKRNLRERFTSVPVIS